MRRVLLFCGGILLGLAAGTILWIAPDLYTLENGWHSAAFTRMVGLGIIVEGVLAALGAAVCLGRAIVPLTSARTRNGTAVPGSAPVGVGGGPVLPLCGILFLLAAVGPFGRALHDSETLEVMDSMPGHFGGGLVNDFRRHERTEWTFGVLWLVVGGALLATRLFLKPHVWQLSRRMSGVGFGIALGGFLLSGMGAFVSYANSLALEGASQDVSFAGYLGVLAGAIIAVVGSVIAAAGRSKAWLNYHREHGTPPPRWTLPGKILVGLAALSVVALLFLMLWMFGVI
jgi:hypothetical protein